VAAVVCAVDLGRLFARPPGAAVDFVAVSLAEARELRNRGRAESS
jgi:allophanate hydrolase subunit 2